jgi:hypothetical protein
MDNIIKVIIICSVGLIYITFLLFLLKKLSNDTKSKKGRKINEI